MLSARVSEQNDLILYDSETKLCLASQCILPLLILHFRHQSVDNQSFFAFFLIFFFFC